MATELKKMIVKTEQYQSTLSSRIDHEIPLNGKLYNGFTLTKKLTLTAKDNTLDFFSTDESAIHREIPLDNISGWTVIVKSIGNDVPVIMSSAPPKTSAIMDNINELASLICIDNEQRQERSKGNDSGSDTEIPFAME